MASSVAGSKRRRFTVKSLLTPLLTHPKAAQIIKYSVYGALLVNFGIYFYDDYHAYLAALPPDAPWSEIFEQFSTTIDTIGWLGLVFLFELETYALPERFYKEWVPWILKSGRLICYVSIGYAAYGYTAETLDLYDVHRLPGIDNACQLADQGRSMQMNSWSYEEITSDNCTTISSDDTFFQVDSEVSVISKSALAHNRFAGWIDVLNAIVWLIVVFLIEAEVWLQEADQFTSRAIDNTRFIKTFFYLVLIGDAVIWTVIGYPLYAWDAFLWIFGFWAIELNLAEWERDRVQELHSGA